MMDSTLRRALHPSSIAVIGASKNPTKRGHQSIVTLLEGGFKGPIYPVNPTVDEVLGLRTYASVTEIKPIPDLALIATPAASVPEMVAECGRAGVAGVVVLAVGFRESGPAGARLEEAAVRAAADSGVRLIGPNTSGLMNMSADVNLVGLRDVARGDMAIITQSGNLLLALMLEASRIGEGLSFFVGPGNQSDVGFAEYLEYLREDAASRIVILYLEGVRDGVAMLHALRETTARKPVVVLTGGKTEGGRRAALSHTGSVASSPDMVNDLLRQAGAIVVQRSDELVPIAHALTKAPLPRGNRVVVLADGGGHGTITADTIEATTSMRLAELAPETVQRLRELLPPAAGLGNPVDVAGATDREPKLFAPVLQALVDDPGVDLVVMVGIFGGYGVRFHPDLEAAEMETASELAQISKFAGVPLVAAASYAVDDTPPLRRLREHGVPVNPSIEKTVAGAAALCEYAAYRASDVPVPPDAQAAGLPLDSYEPLVLTEPQARERLESLGISVGPWGVATSPEQASRIAAAIPGPVAMKVVSPDVAHKSDVGGVELEVPDPAAAADAFDAVKQRVLQAVPHARVDGMLMSPMAPRGVEVLIGLIRHPVFGPVLAFGAGGVLVETVRNLTFRSVPISQSQAESMLSQGLTGKLLAGVRGRPPADRERLSELLVQVSTVCALDPTIVELDLNPVLAHEVGVSIVDVRIVIADRADG